MSLTIPTRSVFRLSPPNAVAVVLFLVLGGSCFGSDAAYCVETSNATADPVVYSVDDAYPGDLAPVRRTIQPGAVWTECWRQPFSSSEPPATVRAEDEDGALIYCRRYSYKDIQEASFKIDIVRGDIRCS